MCTEFTAIKKRFQFTQDALLRTAEITEYRGNPDRITPEAIRIKLATWQKMKQDLLTELPLGGVFLETSELESMLDDIERDIERDIEKLKVTLVVLKNPANFITGISLASRPEETFLLENC